MFEPLEQRIALAADIATIGLARDDGAWQLFASEISLDDDDQVSDSEVVLAGPGGPTVATASTLDSIERLSIGRFNAIYEGDVAGDSEDADPSLFDGFDAETNANFFAADGYPNGFFAGLDDDASAAGFEIAVERAEAAQLANLQGQWLVQMARYNVAANRVETLTGSGTFGGQFLVMILSGASGVAPFVQTIEYTVPEPQGKFTTVGDTARLYLNTDASVMIGVDFDTTDGAAWMFSAVRTTSEFTADDIAGDYRIGAFATSDDLQAALGVDAVTPLHLELSGQGQFRVSELFEDDRGAGPAVLAGSFTIAQSTLTLFDPIRGIDLTFLVSDNGSTLQASDVDFAGGSDDRLFALGARVTGALPPGGGDPQEGPIVPPEGDILLTEVRVSPTGRPEAYELDESDQWRRVDLLTRAEGDAAPIDEAAVAAETWIEPDDGRVFAAVAYPSATLREPTGDGGALGLLGEVS
ncbi:MAG: hypothetical protein AAGK04_12375, partial [Planctomycetota bacterium]